MQPLALQQKKALRLLTAWSVLLFVAVILSVFLHEDGHGFGARLDGIHISTGFNKVGDYGKYPDAPDFRASNRESAFWSGLLGPVTTWLLALIFTLWLYRFPQPNWGALLIGALAIANGLIRAVPMSLFLLFALMGKPHLEDEVRWGVWYIMKFCRPELAGEDGEVLLATQPTLFLSDPYFWLPPLLSLTISLACLMPACRRLFKLWQGPLPSKWMAWAFGALPLLAYMAALPVLNALDRLIRINW